MYLDRRGIEHAKQMRDHTASLSKMDGITVRGIDANGFSYYKPYKSRAGALHAWNRNFVHGGYTYRVITIARNGVVMAMRKLD